MVGATNNVVSVLVYSWELYHVSGIIPVSLVARLLVERPDIRGSIPGWGGGIFMPLLVALLCLLSSGHGLLPIEPGPTTPTVLMFFKNVDIC